MVSLEKIEIAKYLRDYAMLAEKMRYNPDVSMYSVFASNMVESGRYNDCNQLYFDKMLRVYSFYTELKFFSFYEDLQIDYISENELLFDEIKSSIFINPEDSKCFSKKQIIKYIRNAFNHSDGNKELYSISVNGKYLAINLENTKPKPFHIKLTIQQLDKITGSLINAGQNLLLSNFKSDETFDIDGKDLFNQLDKIKFKHYYFAKKIDREVLNKATEIMEKNIATEEELKEKLNAIESLFQNEKHTVEYFELMPEQKEKIYEAFKQIRLHYKNGNFKKLGSDYIRHFMHYFLNKTVPLGMYHTTQIRYEEELAMWYVREGNLSYNDVSQKIDEIYFTYDKKIEQNDTNEYSFAEHRYDMMMDIYDDKTLKMELMLMHTDKESRIIYPLMMYLGFILDNLCNQDIIVIGNKEYPKEKIRNSIVHGRWFIGKNKVIQFYDCPSGNNNDYKFNWHESISSYDLKEWGENYYNNNFESLKRK